MNGGPSSRQGWDTFGLSIDGGVAKHHGDKCLRSRAIIAREAVFQRWWNDKTVWGELKKLVIVFGLSR